MFYSENAQSIYLMVKMRGKQIVLGDGAPVECLPNDVVRQLKNCSSVIGCHSHQSRRIINEGAWLSFITNEAGQLEAQLLVFTRCAGIRRSS